MPLKGRIPRMHSSEWLWTLLVPMLTPHFHNLWLRLLAQTLASCAAPSRAFWSFVNIDSAEDTRDTAERRGTITAHPFIHIRKKLWCCPKKVCSVYFSTPSNIHVPFLCFYHLGCTATQPTVRSPFICHFYEHPAPRQSKTHLPTTLLPFSDTNITQHYMAHG